MAVRRARSAWVTRAVADWRLARDRSHFGRHHVLAPEELDDGLRLTTALLLDPRQVSDSEGVELPDELKARVDATGPLVHGCCWGRGRRFRPGDTCRRSGSH